MKPTSSSKNTGLTHYQNHERLPHAPTGFKDQGYLPKILTKKNASAKGTRRCFEHPADPTRPDGNRMIGR
jgi:hypothetical protein